MKKKIVCCTVASFLAAYSTLVAAPLPTIVYQTDFETDQSANFTTITTGAAPNAIADYFYSFNNFDGRSGKGMYFQVKTLSQSQSGDPGYSAETGAAVVGGALSTSVLGNAPLSPTFRLNFDIYTSSAPPGSGTTEFGTVWVNGNGTENFGFVPNNYAFYKSTDGDSTFDYRLYNGSVYQSNGTVNVAAGEDWKVWKAIELTVDLSTQLVTASVDGAAPYAMAGFDPSLFTAGVPTFAHADTSGNSSADASAQFILFDNLVISVPEPGSLALLCISILGALRFRPAR